MILYYNLVKVIKHFRFLGQDTNPRYPFGGGVLPTPRRGLRPHPPKGGTGELSTSGGVDTPPVPTPKGGAGDPLRGNVESRQPRLSKRETNSLFNCRTTNKTYFLRSPEVKGSWGRSRLRPQLPT